MVSIALFKRLSPRQGPTGNPASRTCGRGVAGKARCRLFGLAGPMKVRRQVPKENSGLK